MRISFTGLTHKYSSEFFDKFMNRWPNYLQSSTGSFVPDDISLVTSQQEQWENLNKLVDEMQEYRNNDYIFYHGSAIDNIVYSIWANAKGHDYEDEYIQKCLPIVAESMKFIDVVFYVPDTKHDVTDIDEQFDEIQNLYTAVNGKWQDDESPFFIKDDRPPVIEIFGDTEQRLEIISLYMDEQGDSIGAQGIIDPGELEELEKAFGIK